MKLHQYHHLCEHILDGFFAWPILHEIISLQEEWSSLMLHPWRGEQVEGSHQMSQPDFLSSLKLKGNIPPFITATAEECKMD